jgi:hypothetical protein
MKILVGKTFGIGNAIQCVPMLKALRSLSDVSKLDVLIGTTFDDAGASDVMRELKKSGIIDQLHLDNAKGQIYDVAVMSIPFDGRWHNGIHFDAVKVLDGRPRPDPSTTGLSSWKKHEVLYQMDNAFELGYNGDVPSCQFMQSGFYPVKNFCLYLGVGYKKDPAGFWAKKHWGNENFAEFCKLFLKERPDDYIVITGNNLDLKYSIMPIMHAVGNEHLVYKPSLSLYNSFMDLSECHAYIGNDTGMMHAAASFNMNTAGLFFLENSHVKSPPWTENKERSHVIYDPNKEFTPEQMMEIVNEF